MAKTKRIGTVIDGLTITGTKRIIRPSGIKWKYLVRCSEGHVTAVWSSTVTVRILTCSECKKEAMAKSQLRIKEERKKQRADARKKRAAKERVFRDVRNGMTIADARKKHDVSRGSIREKIADMRSTKERST